MPASLPVEYNPHKVQSKTKQRKLTGTFKGFSKQHVGLQYTLLTSIAETDDVDREALRQNQKTRRTSAAS